MRIGGERGEYGASRSRAVSEGLVRRGLFGGACSEGAIACWVGRVRSVAVLGLVGGLSLNGAGRVGWHRESGSGLPQSKAFGWLVERVAAVHRLAQGSGFPDWEDSGDDQHGLLGVRRYGTGDGRNAG